jgi:hypothetical protein
MKIIDAHQQKIRKLCIKYNVLKLYVFGSIVKGNYTENSDIDFVVYFKQEIPLENYADNFFDFIYELENVFNRKIDMVSGKAMKNPYFIAEVEQTKKLVYDHTNQKIAV